MKKCGLILIIALLLSGCGAQETFETVSDIYAVPVSVTLYEVQLTLPDDVLQTMVADDGSTMYLCDGYTATVQTLEAGDLDRTFRSISGFSRDALTVMQTQRGVFDCYETAWCAAGEGADQICRTIILDDGNYHYAVTVMADYDLGAQLHTAWTEVFDSISLVSTD